MKKIKNYILVLLAFILIVLNANAVFGQDIKENTNNENLTENILSEVEKNVDMGGYISSLQEYVENSGIEDVDISDITSSLIKNGSIDYKNLLLKILSIFSKDLIKAITGATIIFIIIIIMAIVSSLELEESSDIAKLTHLVCYLAIVVIMYSSFVDIVSSFRSVITTLTTLMQIISPFLMAVIIATGKITSIGMIKPMVLFIASAIGFIINYIVIPFICISVSLNIISNISENLNLGKLSKFFNSFSMWSVSVILTIFLGVLSLETTLTSSVDTLAVKVTQTAVSNFIPVVGKFFSDSFETVVGATKIIANVGGIIGIIVIFLVSIVPILKIFSTLLVYVILSSLIEPILKNEQISKCISGFVSTYKTLLGILIGVAILFVISTGIILNLVSSVVS